ncbi:MAG: hypothetical protein NT118_11465, partial [Lentisphaerae bacterium]|nr:hypothetical protein [Lentisphaerota bacterium]
VVIGILGGVINRMGWSGNQGYSVAARNAHEQKLSGVLAGWRSGFEIMMYLLLGIVGMTYLNSDRFQNGSKGAVACRTELAVKAVNDVAVADKLAPVRKEVIDYLNTGTVTPELQGMLDKTVAIKAKEEADRDKIRYIAHDEIALGISPAKTDTAVVAEHASEAKQLAREARVQTARDAIQAVDPGAAQTFSTIFGQMRVPMALRYLLPIGITGLFCAICIFLMVSTDTSYMLSWSSIIVQDVILPIRRKPFTPKEQLSLLRWIIASVAVFAFFFSYFFGQVDYILMFFAITGAIWLGGSGPCIVGGLYWKRGTAIAAWAALISGSSLSVLSIIVQKYWVGGIYPWLYAHGLVDTVAVWLERISSPFEPIIKWRMSSEKFPINSQEVYAIAMLVSIGLYVIISLITSRGGRVFNMDRMLHRGKYHREGVKLDRPGFTLRNLVPQLIGIDNQYTRGDKILAWSVFIWSFGWGFLVSFVFIAVWNIISPWSNNAWLQWFFINNVIVAGIIGMVSTVWFCIGGTLDLRRLFRDLAKKEENVLDDGRVIGHVSADDVELVEQIDNVTIAEAHAEEEILRKELEQEHDQEDLDNLNKHTNDAKK